MLNSYQAENAFLLLNHLLGLFKNPIDVNKLKIGILFVDV